MIYEITLYQIDENNKNASTRIYAGWKKNESRFDFKDYTLSYNLTIDGEYDKTEILNEVFNIFNGGSSHSVPKNFPKTMHYMSTSDVIQYENKYYFKDIKGYIDVTERI